VDKAIGKHRIRSIFFLSHKCRDKKKQKLGFVVLKEKKNTLLMFVLKTLELLIRRIEKVIYRKQPTEKPMGNFLQGCDLLFLLTFHKIQVA